MRGRGTQECLDAYRIKYENRVRHWDALPMLSREVEECHKLLAVFLQTQRCFRVFGLVGFDEQIKCLLGISLGLSLPDIMDRGFGFFELWRDLKGGVLWQVSKPARISQGAIRL